MSDSISTLAELKAASQTPTAARNRLTYLFDEGKFTELDAYAAAGDSLAGVITAFGYVEGNPVYAFSQDVTVKDGALTEAQAKTYDALLDALNVEMDGEQYDSVAAAAADAALCSVEGGVDYYNYLLQKYSGVDGAWGDFREILANEANGNYQVMNDLMGGDSTLQVGAASFTKQAPDDAYAYDTVSASSSALKKNLVCNGFVNGWTEFGIIRAYLNDDRLDDNLRNYLIASTRMTYALYGVADISVHAGGWGEAEVTDLCTTYFGEAGGSSRPAAGRGNGAGGLPFRPPDGGGPLGPQLAGSQGIRSNIRWKRKICMSASCP